jgi:hypothetical protein
MTLKARSHASGSTSPTVLYGMKLGICIRGSLLGHSSLATTATYVSHIAPAKAVAEATAKTAHLAVAP